MINPSWRRFLSRKRFEVVFESKVREVVLGIESGRRKIINHDFEQGQGNPPSCQRFAVHDEACHSGWISLSLYKVVVDSYNHCNEPF